MLASWPCLDTTAGDPGGDEFALIFDRGRSARLLILPALFDEQNRLRRFTVETMRLLDAAGVDCFLPDWPGTNESPRALADQSMAAWSRAAGMAASHFRATHVLGIRAGALVAPALPGWSYAPTSGSAILRQMLRARILAAREAGREENQKALLAVGQSGGLELAGYRLGAVLITELPSATPPPHLTPIPQSDIGGPGLWLRAEPDENAAQSAALAARIAAELIR